MALKLADDTETAILCGYCDLLAATFGEDKTKIRERQGLPPIYPLCPVCSGPRRPAHDTCSNECLAKLKDMHIPLYCENCGIAYSMGKGYYDYRTTHIFKNTGKPQRHFFCSPKCRGSFVAKRWGFGVNPAGRYSQLGVLRYDLRKYNYGIIARMLESGYRNTEVARELCIKVENVHLLIKRVRREYGLPAPSRVKIDRARVAELYFSGVKPLSIASELGCSLVSVYNIIAKIKRGVPQLRDYCA